MVEKASDEDRAERISAVFSLLTGKLEDAALLAAEGQGSLRDGLLRTYAEGVAALGSEAAIIASALVALLGK